MTRITTKILGLLVPAIFFSTSCKKNSSSDTDTEELKAEILSDISSNVCKSSYEDLFAKSDALLAAVTTLNAATNETNLTQSRAAWKNIRTTWERTESWLFGPVEADNIDPRIDSWPVDFNDLDAILNNNDELTEAYVDNLGDFLKGFHPIEYILWGRDGNKTAAQFTAREKAYLVALAQNLRKLCGEVRNTWSEGYATQLATAGKGSAEFSTQQEAYFQLVDAMSGICEEVANAKIKEPFDANDPSQEESPFAKNSFTDFSNNITGVLDMYQGKFTADGKGIEDLVRNYNLSLDTEIKSKHAAAIAALAAFNKPFGEAIGSEQSKIQNAMDKINDLQAVLDGKLRPFIQQYVK